MKKPRITISLPPEDYAVLAELAELNGESMSSIVAGLVHSVSPALSRVAQVVRVASSAQGEVLENLRRVAEDSEAVLSPVLLGSMDAFDEATAALLVAGGAADPRPVTRGSGSPQKSTIEDSEA